MALRGLESTGRSLEMSNSDPERRLNLMGPCPHLETTCAPRLCSMFQRISHLFAFSLGTTRVQIEGNRHIFLEWLTC